MYDRKSSEHFMTQQSNRVSVYPDLSNPEFVDRKSN